MSVQPFPNPKFRAFDTSGNPLSGGLLYTYSAGTTTPLATYTTRAGTTPNANPVVLDANGEADVWTTPGVDYKFVLKTSGGSTLWTVDNIPSPRDVDVTSSVGVDPGGRLSLTSATPVTTSDVSGATTIYYVPYRHDKVPLYDGTTWTLYDIATELSQATTDATKSPAAVANNSNYDLFVWSDSGTLRLSRGPAWSSDTSRGTGAGTTELEQVDGRYVNKASISNGPAAQRGLYVGTVRSNASAQINDTAALRMVWNNHHRRQRPFALPLSPSHTYSSTTVRQLAGSAANQVECVIGLREDSVRLQTVGLSVAVSAGFAGVGFHRFQYSLGENSTTANSSDGGAVDPMVSAAVHYPPSPTIDRLPSSIGYRYFTVLEAATVVGGGTFQTGAVEGALFGHVWG